MKQHQTTKLDFTGQEFFIGIDVHKHQWKVTIINNSLELRTISMNASSMELVHYMHKNYPKGIYRSVYEAGFSGFGTHRELEALGFDNIVVNPAHVPVHHKDSMRKSDSIDSRRLARALASQSINGCYVPSREEEGFRAICRFRVQLVRDQARVKNRIKSLLDFQGVQIPANDELTHWSGAFIKYLRELPQGNEHIRETLRRLIEELLELRRQLADLMKHLKTVVLKDQKKTAIIKRLASIPGIGFTSAVIIYSELIDIGRFSRFDKLCSYVGLVPDIRTSGDKQTTLGITMMQLQYLRYVLIEAAWIAVRKDPALTAAFNEFTKRMKKQAAIIRISKKLLNRIMYVWRNDKEYVCSVVS